MLFINQNGSLLGQVTSSILWVTDWPIKVEVGSSLFFPASNCAQPQSDHQNNHLELNIR